VMKPMLIGAAGLAPPPWVVVALVDFVELPQPVDSSPTAANAAPTLQERLRITLPSVEYLHFAKEPVWR
jgi:hypothetical protein